MGYSEEARVPALRLVASAGSERERLREGYREREGDKKLTNLKLPVLVGAIVVEDERIQMCCCHWRRAASGSEERQTRWS